MSKVPIKTMGAMNQDVKSKTKLSRDVLRLKEKSANIAHDNRHNQMVGDIPWNVGPGIKTLKLSMVLLVFLYSSDDYKISIFEKRSFNKSVNSIDAFTKEDKNELKSLLDLLPDMNYILGYIRKWQLPKDVVIASIDFLKKEIGLNSKDLRMINNFKRQYFEIEYI